MRKFSDELRSINFKEFEPIIEIEKYSTDYEKDELYLFSKFDNKNVIIKFQKINDTDDIELSLLSSIENSFINIDTHTINLNNEFEYNFYKYVDRKINCNEFFNVEWKLRCIPIDKDEFLQIIDYKDKVQEENQAWGKLIEEFKKLNYTPSEIRNKILINH